MKYLIRLTLVLICLSLSAFTNAGDFDWMQDFNIRAEADQDGVRLRLENTFKLPNGEIDIVWSNTKNPAEAFTVVALADISDRPVRDVISAYQRNQGWGALVRSLGIKPGSKAFHDLKNGQYGQAQVLGQIGGGSSNIAGKGNGNGKGKN